MRRQRLLFAAILTIAVVIITVVAVGLMPTVIEYDPRAGAGPVGFAQIYGLKPEEVLENMLLRSDGFPPPGAQLESLPYGGFAWEPAPSPSAPVILGIVVQRVELTANEPLVTRLLDDDPTYGAEIDVVVTSSEGQVTTLRVNLWDYGLLTPWGLLSGGDGLKPYRVDWPDSSA